MTWNAVQRAHCLETYFRSNSWEQALRTLRREWGRRSVPGRRTLQRWVNSFRERGVLSHAEHRAHGHRTPTTGLRKITRAVRRNPHHSVRQLSRRTGASKSTIHRILRRQLGLFPYKLQLTQRLHRGEKAKRMQFCRWLLGKWASPRFRQSLLFSDEAHFYLNGHVNKQNCRIWGLENPHALVEQDQHPAFVTVWCGLSKRGIIGPYFFQSRGRTATVTGGRYGEMLDTFLIPELQRQHIPLRRVWFQQDGATPHTTRQVLARLQAHFPGKVISKQGTVPWPPRSPDLSPLDFFLWGHLKASVYDQPVRTLRQLKTRISAGIAAITPSTLKCVINHLPLRCHCCLRKRGAHMEGVIPRR